MTESDHSIDRAARKAREAFDKARKVGEEREVEPTPAPPSTPEHHLTLTPGGDLEQQVHTLVDLENRARQA